MNVTSRTDIKSVETIRWNSGWIHTKTVREYVTGGFVTGADVTIVSKKKGVRFVFVQERRMRENQNDQIERVVINPSGDVNERLSSGKMTLSERCRKMDELENWIRSKEQRMIAA